MKTPPRILITCGRVWQALAVTRAFGKLGYQVDVADNNPRAVSRFSRYCHKFHQAPHLTADPEGFGQFIVTLAKKNRYEFIVPLFEEVFVLSKFREELSKYSAVLLNDFETYMTLHHKGRLHEFCVEHGLPTPKTARLDSTEAISRALQTSHQFPVFRKYPVSCAAAGVTKISDQAQLASALEDLRGTTCQDPTLAPVLQQGINGYQIATQAVYKNGEILALHMYKNIAEFPPGSGSGVIRESVSHSGINDLMRKLGRKLNYDGLLGVDFLIDAESNEAYLIDANPRLPLGYQNAHLAGAHLLESYVAGVTGRTFDQGGAYREGVRSRTLIGHLYWLSASLFKLRGNPVEVLKTYLKDRKGSHPEIFDWHDFLPTLVFPWIILSIQFQQGKTIMEKFLHGATFTQETLIQIESVAKKRVRRPMHALGANQSAIALPPAPTRHACARPMWPAT